jgi:7-cyano-7-deazaguanine synthase
MKKAIVLLSGGVDSTVTLAIAKNQGFDIYALSFDYGQRHVIELTLAKKSAVHFHAAKHLVIKSDLREIGGSALTSDIEVPKNRIQVEATLSEDSHRDSESMSESTCLPARQARTEIQDEKNHTSCNVNHESLSDIPDTYVPARNTIFLSFGLAFAESIGAEDIFIGVNAVDYSGYPDCRPEFIRAFESMANLATKTSVEGKNVFKIQTPLIHCTKAEIIRRGVELGVDFSLAWSCYDPQPAAAGVQSSKFKVQSYKKANSKLRTPNSELIPCKRCDSCILRAKGFREAGIEDPLILKSKR